MLTPIDSSSLQTCEWRQEEAFRRSWELWDSYKQLAELRFPKMFGSSAVASIAGATWTFKRVGFFSPRTTARPEGGAADIAVYEPNFSGSKGTLTVGGGAQVRLRSANFWSTEWVIEDPAGTALVVFHNKGMFKHGATVEVSDAGRGRTDLALLLTFGWYILVLYMEDASAGAATATIG
jgi:hypothetical protein